MQGDDDDDDDVFRVQVLKSNLTFNFFQFLCKEILTIMNVSELCISSLIFLKWIKPFLDIFVEKAFKIQASG